MTELFASISTLLAQSQRSHPMPGGYAFKDVADNFGSDGLIATNLLMVAVGALMLLISGLSISRWWKHRGEYSNPLLVFIRIAGVVGLSYRDQWLLWRIARRTSLASPLSLLLSPGTFESHAKAYLQHLPGWRLTGTRQRAKAIRSTLFTDLTPTGA